MLKNANYGGVHLGHKVGGFPEFDGWPRWDSFTHQSMHLDWLERAWLGGLRLMIVHAVNNEYMCRLAITPKAPGRSCADMEAVDLQLQAARAFEAEIDAHHGGGGRGWYRIVRSPSQAAATIVAGKLAVILGIEVDYLFGSYLDRALTEQDVSRELDKYAALGVRVIYPIHFADNRFGGTAFQNGLQKDITGGNNPLNPDYFYELTTEDAKADYSLRGGRRNVRGLTDLGKFLVNACMSRGIVIDVDHMSFKSRSDTLDIAERRGCPVMSGHTGFNEILRNDKRHEGQLTDREVKRLRRLGSLIAPIVNQGKLDEVTTYSRPDGTSVEHVCGSSSNSLIQAVLYALHAHGGGATAIGTDFNGFAGLPGPRSGPDACPGGSRGSAHGVTVVYPFKLPGGDSLDHSQVGNKQFNIADDGLAHIGMLPDMLAEFSAMGLKDAELDQLLHGAEAFVAMWSTAWSVTSQGHAELAVAANASGALEVFGRGTVVLPAPSCATEQQAARATDAELHAAEDGLRNAPPGQKAAAAAEVRRARQAALEAQRALDACVGEPDYGLHHSWQDTASGAWSAWTPLGGQFAGDPAVGVNKSGALEVFARATDNGIYHSWQDTASGAWSAWTPLGPP